jgi:serine/threonine-protein kinase
VAGRYEILRLLGAGGMGSVYLARDTELDELVALKTLSLDLGTDAGVMERFRREVKLARKVTHKNVARTYDIGEHQGLRFLTMEYLEGEPLSVHLGRTGKVPLSRATEIALQIADGLMAAHEAGVVHRDLKPDNVILGSDLRVKIMDFGIARAFSNDNAKLTAGRPLGTPAYMAPEQVEGKDADHRADIYALGEMLYEMLTGQQPWNGDSIFAVAAARLVAPPPDPCVLVPTLPRVAADLIMKAMSRDPAQRHATVGELREALAAIASLAVADASLELSATQVALDPAAFASAITNASTSVQRLHERSIVPPPSPSAPRVDGTKVIAVLPFRNAGKPEDDYLVTAFSESLTDTLSMNGELRVPSMAAALAVLREGDDTGTFGKKLGADVVASGSIMRNGEGLRITARLLGVGDGFQIWAKRLEGPVSDVLRLADETADAIVAGLSVRRRNVSRDLPEDPRVLDLYLRAQHAYRTRSYTDAIALLNEALAHAPDEPALLAALARAQLVPFNFDLDPVAADEAGRLAREAAERALAIAPHAALPHFALGELEFAHGNLIAAVREYGLALAANPRHAESIYNLGRIAARAGDVQAGLRLMKRAELLEPSLPFVRGEQVAVRELAGEHALVDELLSTTISERVNPYEFWFAAAQVWLWRRDREKARDALARLATPAFDRPRYLIAMLASGKITQDNVSDMDRLSRAGAQSSARTAFFRKMTTALALAADEVEMGMEALREADSADLYDTLWMRGCRLLDVLRPRPEFQEIEARVAARAAQVVEEIRRIKTG